MAAVGAAVHGWGLARPEGLHFLNIAGALSGRAARALLFAVDMAMEQACLSPCWQPMSKIPALQPCTSTTSQAQPLLAPTSGLAYLPPLLQFHADVQIQLALIAIFIAGREQQQPAAA